MRWPIFSWTLFLKKKSVCFGLALLYIFIFYYLEKQFLHLDLRIELAVI